ncbi:DNA breaking-rejoining protein [Escherichia coli]|nr:DNA breaking-rejoining protein [Escherichia coli]
MNNTSPSIRFLLHAYVSLVVFSSRYRPRRGDRVVYDGQQWTVTRHERFNGKPMIFIE